MAQQYPPHYQQEYTQHQQEYAQHQQMHAPQQPNIAHTYTPTVEMNPEKPAIQPNYTHNHTPKIQEQGGREWAFSLFDCFSPLSTCCISFWCPCYLFGKTQARNKTGEKDPSGFTGMCCAYAATLYCGCAPILQCMQRQSTRDKHGIEGNCFGDFCTSCCCACCALVQEEKESVVRHTGVDPTTGMVYQPVQHMTYP